MTVDIGDYLQDSSYQGEAFPVVRCETTYGHDSAKHQRFGGNGADIQSTGRKPVHVSMTIAFVDGLQGGGSWPDDLFPGAFERVTEKLRNEPIGNLNHPTLGPITVHVDDVSEPLDAGQRNGVLLTVQFTQHLEDDGLDLFSAPSTRNPPATAASQAEAADAVRPDDVSELAPAVTDALEAIEAAGATYSSVLSGVNTIVAACEGRLQYASVQLIGAHEYRVAVEGVINAAWQLREFYGASANPRKYTLTETMPLARVAALPQVYGDPSKASLLAAANRVPDPAFVPAGTVLVVPRD